MTTDAKREELREKIEAAEARNEERTLGQLAVDAKDSATQFVKENPGKTVAGGIAVGLVIGAIMNRGRISRAATHFGTLAAEMGSAYAMGALDAFESGQDKLEDIGDTVGAKARAAKRDAGRKGSAVSDAARLMTRRAARKAGRGVRDARKIVRR